MARILSRRRPGFRVPRLRRSRRWTGQQSADTFTVGTLATVPIVAPADYQQTATLEAAGVTLVRIRGSIALSSDVGVTAAQSAVVDMMVYVAEADSSNQSPGVVQSLWQEEVLWYQRMLISGGFLTWPNGIGEIDIRAKRKLDNHEVRFAISSFVHAGAAFDYTVVSGWRALLIGG